VVVVTVVVVVVVVLVVEVAAVVVVVVMVVVLVAGGLVAVVLVVVVVVVVSGAHWPVASHTPFAQGVPATWNSHVVVQQESAGSHTSPAPVSSTPSPHRERSAVKDNGFLRGFARTANVPLIRAQVAASTCALSVALPGSPVHAGQVTTIWVNRLRALIFVAAVAGQPLASVTYNPATVSTSFCGPPSRTTSGAASR